MTSNIPFYDNDKVTSLNKKRKIELIFLRDSFLFPFLLLLLVPRENYESKIKRETSLETQQYKQRYSVQIYRP